jgi:hypothetical protein
MTNIANFNRFWSRARTRETSFHAVAAYEKSGLRLRVGRRGGARVTYYWVVAKDQIYMLLAYAKNAQEDLTEEQLKTLRTLIRQEFG